MKTLYKITLLFAFVLLLSDFTFAQTEHEKGIELYHQGKYQEAVISLQKTIDADKNNQESWLYLGMSFAKLKKDEKAIDAFKEADKLPKKVLGKNEKAAKITAKPIPPYTDSARQNQVQGTIALAVEFGVDGTIKSIFPFQTLPNGLTKNTVEATRKINFEPAAKDGRPVSEIRIIRYSFTIH